MILQHTPSNVEVSRNERNEIKQITMFSLSENDEIKTKYAQ